MTIDRKAAAFDDLSIALTNLWANGKWSWYCSTPCGGNLVLTQEEAVADLVQWAKRTVAYKAKRRLRKLAFVRVELPVIA